VEAAMHGDMSYAKKDRFLWRGYSYAQEVAVKQLREQMRQEELKKKIMKMP
jgi:hypothetical protein